MSKGDSPTTHWGGPHRWTEHGGTSDNTVDGRATIHHPTVGVRNNIGDGDGGSGAEGAPTIGVTDREGS